MALMTFKSITKPVSGIQMETQVRGHKMILDEPADLGGTDKGMNPVEAILSALGSCKAIIIKVYAQSKGIDIQDLWLELEGDLDPDGFLHKNDVKMGFQDIRTKIHIKSNTSESKLKEFFEFVDNTCPVADTLRNPAKLTSEFVIEK